MSEQELERLTEILCFLQAITLKDTVYADYEDDRENAIDTLVDILFPE